jgi:hypothetical protein
MPYRIAGIDVHKKMLAVVVADAEIDGDFHFARRKIGTTPVDLRALADWLAEHEVEEVVMESTAQYWRPVWEALEQHWRPRRRARDGARRLAGTLHLAQAQSNRGPGGRKKDFPDAERLVKRLVAQELTLSFVPDVEQRLWRTVMRRKYPKLEPHAAGRVGANGRADPFGTANGDPHGPPRKSIARISVGRVRRNEFTHPTGKSACCVRCGGDWKRDYGGFYTGTKGETPDSAKGLSTD